MTTYYAKKGTTSVILPLTLRDSSDGSFYTTATSAGMTGGYLHDNTAEVALSFAAGVAGDAYSSGKFAPSGDGYFYHIPDGAMADLGLTILTFKHAGAVPSTLKIQVGEIDIEDAVRMGMTALPNANADAAGGLVISDAGGLDIDNRLISATATAALEDQYDGTGLTGDTYPATQAQIGNIAIAGAAINTVAESYTLTTGTQSSGTLSDTNTLDGTTHEHTDTAGAMELYYQFDLGADGVPTSTKFVGRLNGANDSLGVFAYNWAGTSWDQIGTLSGTNGATNETNTYDLLTAHVGTVSNAGLVRIRYYAASGLTTATLRVDQILVSYVDPSAAAIRAEIDANSTQLAAILADTNELQTDDIPGLIAALNNLSAADILTTALTESYSADGAAPTLTQAVMLILQHLSESSISGTTKTVKKLDGSTTAATFTLDDATTPTSVTRAT